MFGEKYFNNKEWQSWSQDEEYEWLSGSCIVGNVGALVRLYQFWSFVFKLTSKKIDFVESLCLVSPTVMLMEACTQSDVGSTGLGVGPGGS